MTFRAWIDAKRDEAQRLHRDNFKAWLADGARPVPIIAAWSAQNEGLGE